MSDIVLVPGGSSRFAFTDREVRLEPLEKGRTPAPRRGSRRGVERSPGSGPHPPQPTPTPVIAGPDTGYPPIKVFTALVNRRALERAISYNSWSELLNAVESDPARHLGADGQLYARVTTTQAFELDRANKVLRELGGKRLVVSYEDPGHAR